MLVIPPKHPAIIPNLKSSNLAHRALPVFVSTLYVRHISSSHWHDYTQLWYTVSGSYMHTVNGKTTKHTAGSLALIFPYTIHSVDTSESDIENLRVIKISIFDDLFSKNIMPFRALSYETSVFDKLILTPLAQLSGKNKEFADVIFDDILSEFSRHHEMNTNKIFTNLSKIFELLVKNNHMPLDSSKLHAAYERIAVVSEATSYIMNEFSNSPTLPEIANKSYMSNNSFANKFKSCTGQTFLSFCTKVKISHAIRLLRFTGKTLSEIASECGFYDSTHLSHTLKSTLGVSPGALKAHMFAHSKTYGELSFKHNMQELGWMGVMTDTEIKRLYSCAIGNTYE